MTRPKKLYALAFVLFCAAAGAGTGAAPLPHPQAQQDKNTKPPTSIPAATAAGILAPDKGKFRILLDGKIVGDEEFEISPSGQLWIARGSTTAHVPGGADIKATGQLKISADGAPIRYDWTAQAQKKASGSVDFANGTAKCAIDLGAATPTQQQFMFASPRVAVLDNNLYYQYAVLAQLYDWKNGGKQEFPVLIPQDMTPGNISVESLGSQQVETAKYEELRVSSTDLEILLYLDATHRLMRLDVPSSKVTIVRQ